MNPDRTAAAAEANRQFGAERAAKDPERLSKAVRVVKTAVALDTLTFDDLIRETVDQNGPLSDQVRSALAALLSGARPADEREAA